MKKSDSMNEPVKRPRPKLREDYARGIPDFALSQVASDATESLKRHVVRYIQLVASDPAHQRKMLASANMVLNDLEQDLKERMEEGLSDFLRRV